MYMYLYVFIGWCGHVKRRDKDIIRWVAERMETGRRRRGRQRKRWMDCVKEDGRVVDLHVVEESARMKMEDDNEKT